MTMREYADYLLNEDDDVLYNGASGKPEPYRNHVFYSTHDHYLAEPLAGLLGIRSIHKMKTLVLEHGYHDLTLLARGAFWAVGIDLLDLRSSHMNVNYRAWYVPGPIYRDAMVMGMKVYDPGPEWDPHYAAVVADFGPRLTPVTGRGGACVMYLNGYTWQNIKWACQEPGTYDPNMHRKGWLPDDAYDQ